MKRIYLNLLGTATLLLFSSWGFQAHKLINRMAVFTLPAEVSVFYKHHINQITEHAIDADKRCYVDTNESPRHFFDADTYGPDPFDSVPIHWSEATVKYTERRLLLSGILPWQVNRSYRALVTAFRERAAQRILRHSSDIGHYLADAHVPLHTTSNYNGQRTGQTGIHAFWESRLPELFAHRYDFLVGRARYIESVIDTIWRIVKDSHALVDSVLSLEAQLNASFPPDRKYGFIERNGQLVRTYSDEYAAAYHEMLNGMVENRMRAAVEVIGNCWYSAWVDAGQPDLIKLQADETDSIPSPAAGQTILGRREWH